MADYISARRKDGVPILSGQEGYFLPSKIPAERKKELERCLRTFDARLRSNRQAVRSIRKNLRDLARYVQEENGQLTFPDS